MSALPDVEISQVGGDVAVDLLNTVSWRMDPARRREHLTSYGHVISWMVAAGLLEEQEATLVTDLADEQPQAAQEEYEQFISLREDTYDALVMAHAPHVLKRRLIDARTGSDLVRAVDGRWKWTHIVPGIDAPGDRLALELERLLMSDAVARFHRCEDEHCGWVFLDTSRHHNRRWCIAADCGNRNRVRAHYNRQKPPGNQQSH